MNINELKQQVQTVEREVEFKPVGKPSGWFFTLRHESAPEVQACMRKFQAKIRDLTLKRKTTAYQNAVTQHEDQLHIAHVVTWRWEEGDDEEAGRPAYSPKALREQLNDEFLGYHLKKFLEEEIGSVEDFLQRSEDN